jgi:hypothetical protein
MLLVGCAERAGAPVASGVVIELDRTQEGLAHEIGTARESVSRAMKQLRRLSGAARVSPVTSTLGRAVTRALARDSAESPCM